MSSTTKSKNPYLLRAFYEWIVDSDLTPYVAVAANSNRVVVPLEFVSEGKIVLNISPLAVRNLSLGDDLLTFDGRFSGNPFAVSVPIANVVTIYAKETGEGMMFDSDTESTAKSEDGSESSDSSGDDDGGGPTRPGGHLKVVK